MGCQYQWLVSNTLAWARISCVENCRFKRKSEIFFASFTQENLARSNNVFHEIFGVKFSECWVKSFDPEPTRIEILLPRKILITLYIEIATHKYTQTAQEPVYYRGNIIGEYKKIKAIRMQIICILFQDNRISHIFSVHRGTRSLAVGRMQWNASGCPCNRWHPVSPDTVRCFRHFS